jgi:ABC-type transporter Mla subunit MlaD
VTPDDQNNHLERTAAAMHGTAERLEAAEANLHRSADESPSDAVTARLHALADQVTAQAQDIDRRADRLAGEPRPLPPRDAGAGSEPTCDPSADGDRPSSEGAYPRNAHRR